MKNSPELTPLLLGLCRTTDKQDAPQVLRLWKLDMDDGELCALRDFPPAPAPVFLRPLRWKLFGERSLSSRAGGTGTERAVQRRR